MAYQGRRLNTREWALIYAELGWRVLPVHAGQKRPIYTGWPTNATKDHDLIARYWQSEPGPNVGIVCGDSFVAFDIEFEHMPAFRRLLADGGHTLLRTPIARTGGGGIHVLARLPSIEATSRIGGVLRIDGVRIGELKGAGGFIVACPSRTDGPYGWHISPREATVAEAPEWLVDLAVVRTLDAADRYPSVLSPSRAVALAASLFRLVADAPEGERNRLLFWASCRAAEHRLDRVAVTDILLAAARAAGLSEREARATISSGLAR